MLAINLSLSIGKPTYIGQHTTLYATYMQHARRSTHKCDVCMHAMRGKPHAFRFYFAREEPV